MNMKPEDYDAWYQTPRGRWIGETEFALVKAMLRAEAAGSLVDVGCGTGYFTRLFARTLQGEVVGIDPEEESLHFARAHAARGERYENARGEALPFADGAFDYSLSAAARARITARTGTRRRTCGHCSPACRSRICNCAAPSCCRAAGASRGWWSAYGRADGWPVRFFV